MSKLNPEIYKLLETLLSTKYQDQAQSQNQNQSVYQEQETELEGIGGVDCQSDDIWLKGRGSHCHCPPHCEPKCPPYCQPKCPPHCQPKCPPHCEPKCPPNHSEPWPWENKKTVIDNKINCGCNPHGRPPMDEEHASSDDFRGGQQHEEAPENWREDNSYAPVRPEEPDFDREDQEAHCKPDKDKKIIIENIVNCGCQKNHGSPEGDYRESAFAYLYFLQVGGATVAAGADVPFNAAEPVKNMIFASPQVTIQKAGNYKIYYGINGGAITDAAQLALTVNGVPQAKTVIPISTTAREYSGSAILTLNENDVLTLRNVPGSGDIALAAYSSVGAQLVPSLLS